MKLPSLEKISFLYGDMGTMEKLDRKRSGALQSEPSYMQAHESEALPWYLW